MKHLHIILLAGVQTRASFFTSLMDRLEQLLVQRKGSYSIQIAYPYGDYRRSLWLQVLDLCYDVNIPFSYRGIGGQRLKRELEEVLAHADSHFLLIGHSGGGIAAYRFARYLHYRKNMSLEQLRIIQIGAPKVKVYPPFHTITTYIQAVDENGKPKDPITRLGYWGGVNLRDRQQGWWEKSRYAPHNNKNISIIGGHADYFRANLPYIHENGQSNLDITFSSISDVITKWK